MIDMHPPPAYVQMVQAEAPRSEAPAAGAPQVITPELGAPQPEAPQPAAPNANEPPRVEVKPLDVGRYLPDTAISATVVVTVTPPTGTVVIYTPGMESSPAIFKGPKTSGEIRLNGRTVYVYLEDGATDFTIQYLDWREP